jgi:hypothetical protein
MAAKDTIRMTPLTSKADRDDVRVRLIEEAVLLIRGEWPAVADGLCESVNRAAGFFAPARELEDAIERTAAEAARVVERLYGPDSVRALRAAASVPVPAPQPDRAVLPIHAAARRRKRDRGTRPQPTVATKPTLRLATGTDQHPHRHRPSGRDHAAR